MSGPPPARRVAYELLRRIDHGGAYANLLLASSADLARLDSRDRAFVTDLVYGTTRMRRACDALVDRFVAAEPQPEVRTLLRLGAYQVAFAGVPDHAAVGETVALAPKAARGFVNAVLRRVAGTPMRWPDDAVRLSYPDWIVDRLRAELGHDDALATLEAMNVPAPVTTRADGYVQDLASQWVAGAVGAQPGERVLDVCAAPGGKATALAATGAFVVAADLQQHRARLIAANATATGHDLATVVADGTRPPFASDSFDRVLLDAPCSGLGALRRRPDARWRITPRDVDDLVALQGRLLTASATLVRPGGVLLYSVCTLLAAESVEHAAPEGFELEPHPAPPGPWRAYRGGWRILPHDADTDGMTLVRYRRRA